MLIWFGQFTCEDSVKHTTDGKPPPTEAWLECVLRLWDYRRGNDGVRLSVIGGMHVFVLFRKFLTYIFLISVLLLVS